MPAAPGSAVPAPHVAAECGFEHAGDRASTRLGRRFRARSVESSAQGRFLNPHGLPPGCTIAPARPDLDAATTMRPAPEPSPSPLRCSRPPRPSPPRAARLTARPPRQRRPPPPTASAHGRAASRRRSSRAPARSCARRSAAASRCRSTAPTRPRVRRRWRSRSCRVATESAPSAGTVLFNPGGPGIAGDRAGRQHRGPVRAAARPARLADRRSARNRPLRRAALPARSTPAPRSRPAPPSSPRSGRAAASWDRARSLYGSAAVADDFETVRAALRAGSPRPVGRVVRHVPHAGLRRSPSRARPIDRPQRRLPDQVRPVGAGPPARGAPRDPPRLRSHTSLSRRRGPARRRRRRGAPAPPAGHVHDRRGRAPLPRPPRRGGARRARVHQRRRRALRRASGRRRQRPSRRPRPPATPRPDQPARAGGALRSARGEPDQPRPELRYAVPRLPARVLARRPARRPPRRVRARPDAIGRRAFRPFSPAAWTSAGFEATDTCIDWPAARQPAHRSRRGATMPDVPVLVLSGDLDANTPSSAGRQVARQFPRATFAGDPERGPHADGHPMRPGTRAAVRRHGERPGQRAAREPERRRPARRRPSARGRTSRPRDGRGAEVQRDEEGRPRCRRPRRGPRWRCRRPSRFGALRR